MERVIEPAGAERMRPQAAAICEVTLVLAAAHVTCRAFKQFTSLGQAESAARLNFSPGWCLALFACAMIVMGRRDFAAFGLVPWRWPGELKAAIDRAGARSRTPATLWWIGIVVTLVLSILAGLRTMSAAQLAGLLSWQLLATAVGEEVFFRGYVQTRLNEVFPRPWAIRGVRFGSGLLIMAALFGVLHAFNTVDYFAGRLTFAWALAATTTLTALLFGLLREATGSVAPGIALHFLNNILWFTMLPSVTRSLLSTP